MILLGVKQIFFRELIPVFVEFLFSQVGKIAQMIFLHHILIIFVQVQVCRIFVLHWWPLVVESCSWSQNNFVTYFTFLCSVALSRCMWHICSWLHSIMFTWNKQYFAFKLVVVTFVPSLSSWFLMYFCLLCWRTVLHLPELKSPLKHLI